MRRILTLGILAVTLENILTHHYQNIGIAIGLGITATLAMHILDPD